MIRSRLRRVNLCPSKHPKGTTVIKAEYLWIDGTEPTSRLRSKTKILPKGAKTDAASLPIWGFDGSSTNQAPGSNSDCVLKPVFSCPDPIRGGDHVLVMCEVMMPDKKTPHPSNARATILDDPDAWFGFEQEYFLYKNGRPLGFPCGTDNFPYPQGEYYTGVGYRAVGNVAAGLGHWQCGPSSSAPVVSLTAAM